MTKDVELINFKIPKPMKKQFQDICRSRNLRMTSVLNGFIAEFIRDNAQGADNDMPLAFFSDNEQWR